MGCYNPTRASRDVDAATVDAMVPPNLVFVSEPLPNGNMGGLPGADQTCNAQARAAGLTDNFRAVLWTTRQAAADRLQGSRGWVDVAGLPVADLPGDFGPAMLYPPSRTVGGLVVPEGEMLATGFTRNSAVSADCNGWTSDGGSIGVIPVNTIVVSDWATSACNLPTRILCAGIGRQHVLATPQAAGRIAFVAPRIRLVGGIAQADNYCQAAAVGAGLSGTYAAMLAVNEKPARSRFDQIDTPWRRVDGPLLAPSNATFFGLTWAIPLFRDAKGEIPLDDGLPGAYEAPIGDATANCSNWTGSGPGRISGVSLLQTRVGPITYACDSYMHIICLQQ